MASREFSSFSARRRWLSALNMLLSTAAVLALLVMANYLASGYFKRFQWTSNGRFQLSRQTARLLQSLTNQVEVTVFFDPKDESELYEWASGLLKEYNYLNPKVMVKTVDYTRYPGTAELVLARYRLGALKEKNFVIFDCQGRKKIVNAKELANYNIKEVLSDRTKEFRRESFNGEMLFTSAIFAITSPRQQKAYFLSGHREHPPDDKGVGADLGYSKFAAILKNENNVDWQKLSLSGTNEIPADCHLLIIAGPKLSPLSDGEAEKIEAYLKQGGRLLALVNSLAVGENSGLEKILAGWGIGVANNILFEEGKEFRISENDFFVAELLDHPVVKSLAADELRLRMVAPRAVGQLQRSSQAAGAPKAEVLARTSEKAYEGIKKDGVVNRGASGRFPLMAAVDQGTIKGVTAGRGATRILAVGDALFLDNQVIEWTPNHYFAAFAINWLLDRPQILLEGLGPQPVKEYRLLITTSQFNRLRWVFLAALPGAVLALGGLVWLRRRS